MKDGTRVTAVIRIGLNTWTYDGTIVGEPDWDEWNGEVYSVALDNGGILLRSKKDLKVLEA